MVLMDKLLYILIILTISFIIIKSLILLFKEDFKNHRQENFTNESISSNKLIVSNNFSINNNFSILIFLSSKCAYCKEIFEVYWNDLHNTVIQKNIPTFIFINENDTETISFLNLFDYPFSIELFEENFILENNINTMPTFIIIDENKTILIKTPELHIISQYITVGPNQN